MDRGWYWCKKAKPITSTPPPRGWCPRRQTDFPGMIKIRRVAGYNTLSSTTPAKESKSKPVPGVIAAAVWGSLEARLKRPPSQQALDPEGGPLDGLRQFRGEWTKAVSDMGDKLKGVVDRQNPLVANLDALCKQIA
ncbi:hypothetical protein N7461_005539 [Penicillium sp. DV-2018c]|nr:hypothetical protein N7461_005539 [Penicillium sp. DV-2018c]